MIQDTEGLLRICNARFKKYFILHSFSIAGVIDGKTLVGEESSNTGFMLTYVFYFQLCMTSSLLHLTEDVMKE